MIYKHSGINAWRVDPALKSPARFLSQLSLLAFVLVGCRFIVAQTLATDAREVFAYDATKSLNLVFGKSETPAAGVTVSEISYDSPKGGRVPGYLVLPLGKGPFAAVVYMHWGQGNKGEFLSEAVEMAPRGVIGITIDAAYWRPGAPQPTKGKEAEAERDGYIQMVVDLRRAVDVLVARKMSTVIASDTWDILWVRPGECLWQPLISVLRY
jgi:hypothetical protein